MNSIRYDAIIIGSGQAGNPLAHKLADLGWKVALIEKEHLGGSCINYGCTPTKTMLASARLAHYDRKANELGVSTGPVKVDLRKIVARKNQIVEEWRGGQQVHADNRPTLDIYRGLGHFTGPHTVAVNDHRLTSDHIFINTGTRPRILDLPELDEITYLTNRNIMDLTDVPEHLLVLGGSYIDLEFGQMFKRFGSRVTVVEYNNQLVYREDDDIALALQEALENEGVHFRLGARATRVARTPDGIELTFEYQDGRSQAVAGSHLLLAVGRVPNTAGLNLEAAGVEVDTLRI